MKRTERTGGVAQPWAGRARAGRLAWLGLALLGLAWAGGCAKREWVAAQRTAGAWPPAPPAYGTAPVDTEAAAAARALGRRDAAAEPQGAAEAEPALDPVSSGGLPLAGAGERVGAELPWAEPAASGPAAAGASAGERTSAAPPGSGAAAATVDCRRQPCFWVQVAALADSAGAASALARARGLAAGGAGTGPAPGAALVWERGFWKLRLGPYPAWEQADAALRAVRAGGFAAAWLVRP